MRLTVSTWNINSVRLRIELLAKFVKATRPDILCLQETKCPDDRFPLKRLRRLGYGYAALNGQKGHHGVAVLSRLPFDRVSVECLGGTSQARHVAVMIGEQAGLRDPVTVHNFYVPAGGDTPDPDANPKFAHKLAFLDDMRTCRQLQPERDRAILLGDLNVAPLEHDVWSHRQLLDVVSHTPVECDKLHALQRAGEWIDVMRTLVPEPIKLYTWWSYRSPNWAAVNKGRRLDHIWVAPALGDRISGMMVAKQARDWIQPSDHVPVSATIEV
jgi:exodeoxyribonuclease III